MTTSPASSQGLFADALAKATATPVAAPVVDAHPTDAAGEIETPQPNQLDMLKNRARLMGITFSNNIGIDALRAKINAKLDGEAANQEQTQELDEFGEVDHAAMALASAPAVAPAAQPLTPAPAYSADDLAALAARLGLKLVPVNAAPEPKVYAGSTITPAVAPKSGPVSKAMLLADERKKQHAEQMKLVRVRITNMDPKKKNLPGEIFCVANKVLGAVKKYIPFGEATDNGYHIPQILYNELADRKFLDIRTTKDNRGRTVVSNRWVREFSLEILPPLTERELQRLATEQAARSGVAE